MLSPYKTPSARVGVYPNVMPALNFSKIYLRQARQWKTNHSLNKPFQESAPVGSHLIGCLFSKSTVFIMLQMALTFPLSLFFLSHSFLY